MFDNPVVNSFNFRNRILYLFQKLRGLDHFTVGDEELIQNRGQISKNNIIPSASMRLPLFLPVAEPENIEDLEFNPLDLIQNELKAVKFYYTENSPATKIQKVGL